MAQPRPLPFAEYALEPSLPALFHETNQAFISNTPKSRALSEAARKYMPGGNTRASLWSPPYGLTFVSGAGSKLTDVDGRTYDDFLGEYSAGLFGHSHPIIQSAVHNALASGWNLGGQSLHEQALARALVARFSPALEMVRFTNSGTEASTMALATALAWHHVPRGADTRRPRRRKVLVFEGGYHGATLRFPARAAPADPLRPAHANPVTNPLLPDDPVNLPHEFVVAPFDDAEAAAAVALHHISELAAVLVEPMQGSAGARVASVEFLRELRRLCDECGALLIFDEIQTSRLGPAGLGAKMGVRPDLMTLGKWVGGGMTFGAFGGRRDLMLQWDLSARGTKKLPHAGTFNNNVVSMAAGLAGLRIATPDRLEELNKLGDYMRERVTDALEDAAMGTEEEMWLTGTGSIMAVHFGGRWRAQLHDAYFQFMLEHGIYLSPRGFIALSLEISKPQVEKFAQATERFIEKFDNLLGAGEVQRVVLPQMDGPDEKGA